MPVKLNHYWTIIHDKTDEYNKFIVKKFIPAVNQLGMHTVAAWCVMVGAYSEIIFESASNDLSLIENALKDDKYKSLKTELLNYVKNYKTKVLVKTGRKDAYSTDIREKTVKYNQMWDILSDRQEDYTRFTREQFYPVLEELGVFVSQEWEVLIGDGPSIICEGRVTDASALIGNLQNKKFRQVKRKLKEYVENYRSRLLSFHIQKIRGYKSASYKVISN